MSESPTPSVPAPPAIDLDAYFDRIRYAGPREPTLATLNALVAAHTRQIPFENFDSLLGRPVLLDSASLQRKLIHDRRGGYCFEQNGLLLLVLESLGFHVRPISARVRVGRERHFTPARTHLFCRVELDGGSWLADVGVGGLSPTAALRLEFDIEQPTPHEPRRLVREGSLYYHQARLAGQWTDVCEFTLEEMPLIDREVANWYTCTHPQSHFKGRLLVARAAPEGRRVTLLDNEFTIRDADGTPNKRTLTSREELLSVLAEQFGVHLEPDVRFAVATMPWMA